MEKRWSTSSWVTALLLTACGTTTPPVQAPPPVQPRAGSSPAAEPALPVSGPSAPVEELDLPLGAITLTGAVDALTGGGEVGFLLLTDSPQELLPKFSGMHPEARVQADGLLVGEGLLPAEVEPRHLAATFLVDHDQPVFDELAKQLPPGTTAEQVREFVTRHFQTIRYGDFWTASRAATARTGDCSEHAVVVAALARKVGLPARVVVGYVMLPEATPAFALGHAWTQIYEHGRWLHIDATPIGSQGRAYLMSGEMTDESVAYATNLMSLFSALSIKQIRIVEPSPPG